MCCGTLYELPRRVGKLRAGTLLWACQLRPGWWARPAHRHQGLVQLERWQELVVPRRGGPLAQYRRHLGAGAQRRRGRHAVAALRGRDRGTALRPGAQPGRVHRWRQLGHETTHDGDPARTRYARYADRAQAAQWAVLLRLRDLQLRHASAIRTSRSPPTARTSATRSRRATRSAPQTATTSSTRRPSPCFPAARSAPGC